jgi:hypothetical protein
MSETNNNTDQELNAGDSAASAGQSGTGDKLAPALEALKQRRQAQQGQERLRLLEQQLEAAQTQLSNQADQIARAEAQRDELQTAMETHRQRTAAERMFLLAGVADTEAAMLLLEKRVKLGEELDGPELQQAVERLLLDKPYLLPGGNSGGTGKTASRRIGTSLTGQIAKAAARAVQSGHRRDVIDYLRLRRQAGNAR